MELKLEDLTNIRGSGKAALLGLAIFLLNLGFVGARRWEFWYGLVYSIALFGPAIVLASDKPGVIASLCAALLGLLSVAISEPLTIKPLTITAGSAALVSVVLFAFLLLNEFGVFEVGGYKTTAKYLVLVCLLAWFFWPLNYFISRIIAWPTPTAGLPFETVLYHGGVMLWAINEALKLLGIKYERQDEIGVIFVLAAILGAFLLVTQLGWGLQLL